jgi:hypothetical protein
MATSDVKRRGCRQPHFMHGSVCFGEQESDQRGHRGRLAPAMNPAVELLSVRLVLQKRRRTGLQNRGTTPGSAPEGSRLRSKALTAGAWRGVLRWQGRPRQAPAEADAPRRCRLLDQEAPASSDGRSAVPRAPALLETAMAGDNLVVTQAGTPTAAMGDPTHQLNQLPAGSLRGSGLREGESCPLGILAAPYTLL